MNTKAFGAAVLCLIAVSGVYLTQVHATIPSVGLPDTIVCPARAGTLTTQVLTGTAFSAVQGWQISLNYSSSQVSVYSVALGNTWNNVNHLIASNNNTGNLLYGYSTENGATVSGDTTLLTITWKFLVSPGGTTVHFVLTTESTSFGTMLLDGSANQMAYSTTMEVSQYSHTRPVLTAHLHSP